MMFQQRTNTSGAEAVSVLGKDPKGKTSKRISGLQYSQTSWRHQGGTQRRAQEWVRVCYLVNYPSQAEGEGQALGLTEGGKKGLGGAGGRKEAEASQIQLCLSG